MMATEKRNSVGREKELLGAREGIIGGTRRNYWGHEKESLAAREGIIQFPTRKHWGHEKLFPVPDKGNTEE